MFDYEGGELAMRWGEEGSLGERNREEVKYLHIGSPF